MLVAGTLSGGYKHTQRIFFFGIRQHGLLFGYTWIVFLAENTIFGICVLAAIGMKAAAVRWRSFYWHMNEAY